MDSSILRALRQVNPFQYAKAKPFPHVIMDGFLSQDCAATIAESFPGQNSPLWKHHEHRNSRKLACNQVGELDGPAYDVLFRLNTEEVTVQISRILGQDVIADEDYEGGGMHLILKGGQLGIHADFNVHPNQKWIRVANLLVYLNKCEDGDLELWSDKFGYPDQIIEPQPGRAVLFTTSENALHGHPYPLKSPFRKSLAVYYYAPRPPGTIPHSTLYRDRR